MKWIISLCLILCLTACTKGVQHSGWPVFPSDIDDCTYPVLADTSDVGLSVAYLDALGQIKLCNGKLQSVRKLRDEQGSL